MDLEVGQLGFFGLDHIKGFSAWCIFQKAMRQNLVFKLSGDLGLDEQIGWA